MFLRRVRGTLGQANYTMAKADQLMNEARKILLALAEDADAGIEEVMDGVNVEFHLDLRGLAKLWAEYVKASQETDMSLLHFLFSVVDLKNVKLPLIVKIKLREEGE